MAFFADLMSFSLPPFPTTVPSVHIGHSPHHPSHPSSKISPFFLWPLLPFMYLSCIHLRHHQVTCLIRSPFFVLSNISDVLHPLSISHSYSYNQVILPPSWPPLPSLYFTSIPIRYHQVTCLNQSPFPRSV